MFFVNGRARGEAAGESSPRRTQRTQRNSFVIDHLTIVIVHLRLLDIGDCLYFIGYLGARRRSVNG